MSNAHASAKKRQEIMAAFLAFHKATGIVPRTTDVKSDEGKKAGLPTRYVMDRAFGIQNENGAWVNGWSRAVDQFCKENNITGVSRSPGGKPSVGGKTKGTKAPAGSAPKKQAQSAPVDTSDAANKKPVVKSPGTVNKTKKARKTRAPKKKSA